MALDQRLIDEVKSFEGFTAKATWDFHQWTNGWGTKAHRPHEVITHEEADRRLLIELGAAQAQVDHYKPDLPPGVRRALTDLTFNSGNAWMHHDLGADVQREAWSAVETTLKEYRHAGGRILPDLAKRRATEISWFDVGTRSASA